MNVMLNKIHQEHFEIENWQNNLKKQQMRENIAESLRNRKMIDSEMAENLIKKEAQINKLFTPTKNKALNIHENSVKKVGQRNLDEMHQSPEK